MASSPRNRAISPPTPAPSPQPDLRSSLRLASALGHPASHQPVVDPNDSSQLLKEVSLAWPQLSHQARFRFLTGLVDLFDLRELAHLSAQLAPRLKVDFLSSLPIEVSLHILSFIDDPKTLARASCVSRFWRSLVNDEHTWKVMCLKHKYRRRGSTSAGLGALDDRYMRSVSATPGLSSRSLLAGPRLSSISADAHGSVLIPLSEAAAAEEEDEEELANARDATEDDNMVLVSLYQRYRARGLDPSNALHELRTLHDLFLSKQDSGDHVTDKMSDADRAFYAQLEEIVAEESRERYGDAPNSELGRPEFTPHAPYLLSTSRLEAETPSRDQPSSSEEAPNAPHLAGWLSSGPSSISAGTRPGPFSGAISGAYRTPSGRLDRLQGWQNGGSVFGTVPPASSSSSNLLGLGVEADLSATSTSEADADSAMEMDEPEPSSRAFTTVEHPIPRSPFHTIGRATALPPVPHHDSPTGRFSSQHPADAQSSLDEHSRVLVPGPSRPTAELSSLSASGSESHRAIGGSASRLGKARDMMSGANSVDSITHNRKARRRSAPISDLDGQSLGFGRPSGTSDAARSATVGFGGSKPFSYRTHFKLAYLTESNWLRGGRLQTKHVSADSGAVVTSLAIDSEWIVVGMANSKIHVFDTQTGMYSRTLLGHESGVWCLALISRCGKKRKAETSANGKMVVTNPEDGLGGKPSVAAADGDLCLEHHDPRPDATSASLSASSLEFELAKDRRRRHKAASRHGAAGGFARSSSSSLAFDSPRNQAHGDDDETLEWFHKARKALLQKSGLGSSAAADGSGSSSRSGYASDADTSAENVLHARDQAGATSEESERARAAAIAEAEAGSIRDAIMADGTGQVPRHLADQIRRNNEAQGAGAAAAEAAAAAAAAQFGGNAMGLGNPCGSVHGYGNEDAVVVSGGCDRDVRVWDLRTGECKFVLRGHTSTTRCLKVLDGRPIAVSGSRDSTLRVWDIEKGRHLHLLAGHQHSVRCMEVAGTKVASGSYDCTCRVWNVETGECEHVLRGHIHQIYAVAFDGKKIATGSLDSTVRVWSAQTGECMALFQGHTSLVGQLQLLDNILVTGGSDGRVIVFSLDTFECLHRLCAHDNSVTCLQFDDRYIVTGGNDGRVKLWDFQTGKYIREICEPCEQVWKVNYKDDKVVVLCKRDDKTCMDVITFRPTADQF